MILAAVSHSDVEVVLDIYNAFARGDSAGPFDLYGPDIEWDLSRGLAEGVGGVYLGHDGVRDFFRDLLAAFSEINFKLVDAVPLGDRVLATVDEHYVGRASGVEVRRRHYTVWTVRDGTVTAMCGYLDRDEALESAEG